MKKAWKILYLIIIFMFASLVLFNKHEKNEVKNIKVAEVAHSIFYAPQYVSLHNNYFKDEGLNVEIILTPGADKVGAAVLSGDVDIGFSGSEATIYIYNGGEKDYLKTFAQLTQKDGSFIVSREKIKNFDISMLKGKYYIGGRLGGMPEMTLEYILTKNDISTDDLTIDTSIAFANMQASFIGGTGDFVSLFEPNATQVEKEGYGYIVASLGELGGNIPYTSYSAKTSYLENNQDTIKKFTKAIQKGLDFVHNNDSETIAKIIEPEFPDTKLEDLIIAIEQYKKTDTWPNTTNFTEESFNHMQDIMINAKQLDKKVKYNNLIYEIK
jgi:NitT/TauT family transport system substrate-binding protein